ncbi:MAG: hypothetical protein UW71_C0010G0013 [Parcubacteria group bacterium GW2011_GWB1_44_7]|nr:MAG: hypothetical protein UW71_C0010G0013 [Parcubacteria group bacterium GW2011_GWB1_44_7]
MKKTVKILIVILILAALAAAVWYFADSSKKRSDLSVDLRSDLSNPGLSEIYPDTIPEPEQKKMDLPKTFRHEAGFSFSYPDGFSVSRLSASAEGAGETIVVQDSKRQAGFQIHLEPYNDPDTDITAARLARDIPEMKVKDPQDVLIGGASGRNQISTPRRNLISTGLAWVAEDTGTREVWFIFGGTLYQLTAPLSNDTLLQRVLNTWNFK